MKKNAVPSSEFDYPRDLVEFDQRFRTEEECLDYLYKFRWPNGFECPRCSSRRIWRKTRGRLLCSTCRHESTITAGTLFDKTRKPLKLWFHAMWWITSQKYGANALGLQRVLGFGSYQTAWVWLHKLRRAMVRPGRDRLSGDVEVDETYLGGEEENVHGRETETKNLVVIAAEIRDGGIGRIRLRRIEDASEASLMPFITQSIELGSVLHTDGWPSYSGVRQLGYDHKVYIITRSGKKAHDLMPRVHRVSSLLKRWLLGTYQGSVSSKHFDYYLDEYTFRFNRRTSRYRGLLFYRLVEQAVHLTPRTYKDIITTNNSTSAAT